MSDRTGMSASFDVRVDGKIFEIKSTANFDIQSVRFDNNMMIFEIKSSLENNLVELQIPQNITKGQIKFYLDGNEIPAKILQNAKISFATLEFKGNGTHLLKMTSDYTPSSDQPSPTSDMPEERIDQILTIIVVVGIVVAIGAGSTFAYYFKAKPKAS